jgi:hypothetical protein
MQTLRTVVSPHILSGMTSSTTEYTKVSSARDVSDSPLTPLSDLADEHPWDNNLPSSQFNEISGLNKFSCDSSRLDLQLSTNAPLDPQGHGHGGQASDPQAAGRCKRGGQAKHSRSSQQKAVMEECDEFEDVNTSGGPVMGKRFEVTHLEPIPEKQVFGLDGDIFLSCVSSCCRSVQSGTSCIANFDLDVVQQILRRVTTPGHNTVNPYRITRDSAPTNLTDSSTVERWYEMETMKGFLDVCMDLENKESVLQFLYMISAIQFVSKISMYVLFQTLLI